MLREKVLRSHWAFRNSRSTFTPPLCFLQPSPGKPYSATIQVVGNTPPYTFSYANLPSWITPTAGPQSITSRRNATGRNAGECLSNNHRDRLGDPKSNGKRPAFRSHNLSRSSNREQSSHRFLCLLRYRMDRRNLGADDLQRYRIHRLFHRRRQWQHHRRRARHQRSQHGHHQLRHARRHL